jgi:hypothetical protein
MPHQFFDHSALFFSIESFAVSAAILSEDEFSQTSTRMRATFGACHKLAARRTLRATKPLRLLK